LNSQQAKLLAILLAALVICGCIGVGGLVFAPIWNCHEGWSGLHCHPLTEPMHLH
jgi:hypothetical protein